MPFVPSASATDSWKEPSAPAVALAVAPLASFRARSVLWGCVCPVIVTVARLTVVPSLGEVIVTGGARGSIEQIKIGLIHHIFTMLLSGKNLA